MAARKQYRLLEPGSRAPEFQLASLQNGPSTLSGLIASGPALLAFFKVNCPVCQMTFPFLERLHTAGLHVYGISQNRAEDTCDFNREFGISFPTLLDTEQSGFPVSNDYKISSVPTMFLVESNGTIGRVIEGWVRKEIEWLGSQAGIAVIRPGERVPDHKPG
jgi:peroxiredoxin